MVRDLPTGVVTLLFTDVEGSTRLLHELGDGYGDALHEHRRRLRAAFVAHGGVEVDTQGDAFFVAFSRASNAVAAAEDGQRALAAGRSGCAWGCTRVSRGGAKRATWVWTSTGAHVSPQWAMAGRFSSRRRLVRSWTQTSATSGRTGSRISARPSRSSSSRSTGCRPTFRC